MQPVKFAISREGEIVEHPSDFDAVGSHLSQFVDPRTWPWVAHAIGTAVGTNTPQRCLCELRAGYDVAAVVLDITFDATEDLIRVAASSAIQVPGELALDMMFRVAVIDPTHRWPTTIEYETPSAKLAARWVRRALQGKLNKTIAVVPPKTRRA